MKGNVLIVDDEPLLLKNLKFQLEDIADNVFIAENGNEALKLLQNEKIHCVICDINMPRMNGIDVIRNVRENNNAVPFIFYTGHGNQELMLEAAKYGALDFLDKPNLEGLEDVVSMGLKQGLGLNSAEDSGQKFMSEYSKLLEELKK